ncbi:MAG: iron-sulfur cluster carrier protein ApbC [Nevskiaceae bacterium]|jgi:ATP-binding protein involved in chromosome partitioning|nr:iron-sulfur cluster carrier protein ApbC [Nevskiaceae bacterium]
MQPENPATAVEAAKQALNAWVDPWINRSLAELAAIQDVTLASDGALRVDIRLPVPVGGYAVELAERFSAQLRSRGLPDRLSLNVVSAIRAHAVQKPLKPLPGIENIIAVGSAKGGVGKSTVAANMALAWAAAGARVGLLDADIYGPSQPLMMGLAGQRPATVDGKHIEPLQAHGVKVMSIGLLIDPDQPAVWRGPMVTQALTQLLNETLWGELDYLVIDLPPGTGDLQLTLAQRVPVAGAVIVTTPQQIAVADARKGLKMFEKVSVPVLGIVENMATHVCSACGHEDAIFGEGGGERLAREVGVALLGRLPLDARIGVEADGGSPSVIAAPESPRARAFRDLARRTAGVLACRPRDRSAMFPNVVVEEKR